MTRFLVTHRFLRGGSLILAPREDCQWSGVRGGLFAPMGKYEAGTLTALKALRKELFAPKLAEHHV